MYSTIQVVVKHLKYTQDQDNNMGFKFFRGTNNFISFFDNAGDGLFMMQNVQHANNEYCFQFGDEEPVVFAVGNNQLTITLSPTRDGNVIFNNNGSTFKLFARERQ